MKRILMLILMCGSIGMAIASEKPIVIDESEALTVAGQCIRRHAVKEEVSLNTSSSEELARFTVEINGKSTENKGMYEYPFDFLNCEGDTWKATGRAFFLRDLEKDKK